MSDLDMIRLRENIKKDPTNLINKIMEEIEMPSENKVKDPIPVPLSCRYCGAVVELVDNKHIYGKSYGKWPWCYKCTCCDAYVGVHPDTEIPLGTMADKKTRYFRKMAKDAFNPIWKKGHMTRSDAYTWLGSRLGLSREKCHFGMFEPDVCKKAIEVCNNWIVS